MKYSFSKNYKITIAYYFGDTVNTIIDFTDDILYNYIEKCKEKFISYIEDNLLDYDIKKIKASNIHSMLKDNQSFTFIGYEHGAYYVESEYMNIELNKYDMFEDELVFGDIIFSGIADYPYFAYEYKLYIDLENIKNDGVLIMMFDENKEVRFFIVMSFKTSKVLL